MISDWATNQVQWLCFLHSTICVFNAIDCKPLHQTGSQWRCLVYKTPAPPVWQLICYAKLPWPCPCRKVVKFAIDSRGRLSQGYVSCGQMSPGSLIVWVSCRLGHLASGSLVVLVTCHAAKKITEIWKEVRNAWPTISPPVRNQQLWICSGKLSKLAWTTPATPMRKHLLQLFRQ